MRARIPLAGAAELAGAWRRTRLVRIALAVLLIALAIAAVAVSRRSTSHTVRFLPRASNGVVVLDLSASISSDTFNRIGQTLQELAATNGRYGLVVFSDVAYEALPPGTPSSALLGYARYFKVPDQSTPGLAPAFPVNPWTSSFSAGTRISAGLGLAAQMIQRDHLSHPGVILISDLDDDPGDAKGIQAAIDGYRANHYDLRIVALNPAPSDRARFATLLANARKITNANLPGDRVEVTGDGFPTALCVLAALVALALAAEELYAARLTWGTPA
jgi:hypothetical protein